MNDSTTLPLVFSFDLSAPCTRIALPVGEGTIGRAEALFAGKSWAAAHYWYEGEGPARTAVFEFSEALPAGPVRLRVPCNTPSVGQATPVAVSAAV